MQSKRQSIVEILSGTAIKMVCAWAAMQFLLIPVSHYLFENPIIMSYGQNFVITIYFTIQSVTLSYFFRRLFNRLHQKEHEKKVESVKPEIKKALDESLERYNELYKRLDK